MKWPKCYAGACPNTNMSLERFHKELKTKYLKCGVNIRLDILLYNLVSKSRDDLTRRFQKKALDSYSFRDREILKRHTKSKSLVSDVEYMGDGHWLVQSQSTADTKYEVQIVDHCTTSNCLRCRACGVCTHMIICGCDKYRQRQELCKHIHAACLHDPDVIKHRFPRKNCGLDDAELARRGRFISDEGRNELTNDKMKAFAYLETASNLGPDGEAYFYKAIANAYQSPSTRRIADGCPRSPANKLKVPQRKSLKPRKIL